MENFKLKKIKFLEGLGLEATYHEKVVKDSETYWIEKTLKSTIQRHPDLDNVASDLRIHVARTYGTLALDQYRKENEISSEMAAAINEILDTIKIAGVTFSGEDETESMIITAKKGSWSNKAVPMVTPNICYAANEYEYSKDLEEIAKRLINEVYDYLFKRKYAELADMFAKGEVGEASEESETAEEEVAQEVAAEETAEAETEPMVEGEIPVEEPTE